MFESPKSTTARFLPGSPLPMSAAEESDPTMEELENGEYEKKKKKKAEAAQESEVKDDNKQEPEKPKTKPKKEGTLKKPAASAKAGVKPKADKKDKEKGPGAAAKAKAKAKSGPKGKGSTKGKGGAKGKTPVKQKVQGSNTMKRPSAANGKDKDTVKKKGKPTDTVASVLSNMKAGITAKAKEEEHTHEEAEEEEEKEEDVVVEPEAEEKRSKGAAGKFQRLMKEGKIPAHIVDFWSSCTSRADQTKLLNRLFVKNPRTGKWDLQTESPTFKAWLQTTDKNYGKEAQHSFPKAIMLHHYFHGDEQAFLNAVNSGDVQEIRSANNKVMYSFDCVETGHIKERDQKMELHRGSTKLSHGEHEMVNGVLQNFNWKKFGQASPKGQSASSQKPLAITNGPVLVRWKEVEDQLNQAKGAHDRVLKEINKCWKAVVESRDQNMVGQFKNTVTELQKNSQVVSNCLMFKARFLLPITIAFKKAIFSVEVLFGLLPFLGNSWG